MGVLKMDFLGLTTLTLIDDALKMIERRHRVEIVIEELPVDDPGVAEVFGKGFTSGVFQFESPGMRDILRRYQPSRIEDLTALNALYRPGPIQGGMLDDFIERKHGRKAVIYDLPELKELLGETLRRYRYLSGGGMMQNNRLADYSLERRRHDSRRAKQSEEEFEEEEETARALRQRRAGTRPSAEEGRKDLRPDGAVRRKMRAAEVSGAGKSGRSARISRFCCARTNALISKLRAYSKLETCMVPLLPLLAGASGMHAVWKIVEDDIVNEISGAAAVSCAWRYARHPTPANGPSPPCATSAATPSASASAR